MYPDQRNLYLDPALWRQPVLLLRAPNLVLGAYHALGAEWGGIPTMMGTRLTLVTVQHREQVTQGHPVNF